MNKDYVNAKIVGGKNPNKIGIKILLVLLLIAIGAGGMYGVMQLIPGTTIVNKLEKEVTVTETGIADAVEKVYDSVVVIESYKSGKLYSTGSGFIFKKDNNKYYVMTNYHVIESASNVKAVFTDDSTLDVEIVGGDKYSDIAVLSFESKSDYTIAEVGSSTDARVGDTVFAVGAPINSETYSWTVTRGILSGKDRMVEVATSSTSSSDYIMKLLQTDTAINSGNSGGPLCNSNGQVIGITNMKLSSSATSSSAAIENMAFAIPIEDAMEFANKLISGEDITRPVLGVSMTTLSVAQSYYRATISDNVSNGVYVIEVEANSNADAAGIKANDIITEFDNVKIDSVAKLKYELYCHNIGDKVSIKVNRDGVEKTLTVTLKK